METGAASYHEREMGEEWEMREETLSRDFILGRAYGPGLGHLGLGLFSEMGLISGPPPKMGGIF